jgi:hypothetical protein
MRIGTIKYAFSKAGLILFNPRIVLERMDKIEGLRKRYYIPRRPYTPELEDSNDDNPMD